MKSIKLRLSTGLLVSMLFIFAALWLVVSQSISNTMEQYVVTRLQHDAESLLGGMKTQADLTQTDKKDFLDMQRIQGIYQQPFSGHYFVITVGEGENRQQQRSRSLWDQTLQIPLLPFGETQVMTMRGPQNQKLLMYVRAYQRDTQPVQIAVAEDISHLQREIHAFRLRFSIVAVVALLGLIVFQRLILQRGLRPLSVIQADIKRLEQGRVDKLDENVPDEIHPLVNEINRLVKAQQQRLQRSREALGNMAHAIKTPLAFIQHVLGDEANGLASDTRKQLQDNTGRMSLILDHQLKRARLAGHSPGGGQFALQKSIPLLVDTLTQLHKDKAIRFHTSGNMRIGLALDQEDGMELFGNLLDNAWKWAKHEVRFSIDSNDEYLFRIEDDGPGCSAKELEQLVQRGMRFDESTQGYGIGLSIVSAIVESYSGRLSFARSEALGGLRVEIVLPA